MKATDHACLLKRAIRDANTAFADPLVLPWRPISMDAIDIDLVDPCAGESKGGMDAGNFDLAQASSKVKR